MTLTKQDLQDWNSHPVTKRLFIAVDDASKEVSMRSCLLETVDQTAMQAAYNAGFIEGVSALREAFEEMEDSVDESTS